MRFFLIIFFLSNVLSSCKTKTKNRLIVNTDNIKVNFSIDRFDIDFQKTTSKTLRDTKVKYPFLFPDKAPDSVWINKLKSKDRQELYLETQKVFSDFSSEKRQLTQLFKHIKYYYPKFKSPKVITLLSDIDYYNRIIYSDGLLLISLDVYLGKDHIFYRDYPKYIRQNNRKNHIIVDVANAFINKQIPHIKDRTFIGKMIYQGKKMYLLDAYLPKVSDFEKIGYSKEKLKWAEVNEQGIWKYFIENDLLYSTDIKLDERFLKIAPFSKFYRAEDNLSPGQIGVWLGWQIVRSYMSHNENVSLQTLLDTKATEILKKSKYKPRKQ